MNPKSLIIACSLLPFFIATTSAAPVTGWVTGHGNPILSNQGTSSPTMGTGEAESADDDGIYAAFPAITLALGDKLVFSGSFQLTTSVGAAPTALANEFRIGIFNHNASNTTTNWLGYYAGNPSGATAASVRRRSPSSGTYISLTGATQVYVNNLSDTNITFQDATYDFALSFERTASGILLGLTLDSDQGYSLMAITFEDTSANTFTFDRVGFLSGGNLNADQIQFGNLDVTVVPEPSTIALTALGALAVVGYRFRRR